jgi:hypothetical protein
MINKTNVIRKEIKRIGTPQKLIVICKAALKKFISNPHYAEEQDKYFTYVVVVP